MSTQAKHKSNVRHAISESLSRKQAKKLWQHIENRNNRKFPKR